MGLTCVTNKAMGPSDKQLPPEARGNARNCDGSEFRESGVQHVGV